jgi:hypothetical protein
MMLSTVLALSITVIMFIIFIILGAVILWVYKTKTTRLLQWKEDTSFKT